MPAEIERREARLAAIQAARERLEARQREADRRTGREPDDDRTPRQGRTASPRAGATSASSACPSDKAQENFTDPDSRIMKRAGGGFDQSYAPKEVPLEKH